MSASGFSVNNIGAILNALRPLHRWNSQLRTWSRPINQVILQAAQLRVGMRVLDIATGLGTLVCDMSETVGPAGHVVGIDLTLGLLTTARQFASKANLDNVNFQQANAEDLPFSDSSFDLITCLFGVMYFRDVTRALRECARVLRPGGRIILVVWGPKENNPIYKSTVEIISKYVGLPEPEGGTPDPYRFSQKGMLSQAVEHAGLRCMREENLRTNLNWFGTIEELWQFFKESNTYLRLLLHRLPAELKERATDEVLSALQKYQREKSVELPVEVVLSEAELNHTLHTGL